MPETGDDVVVSGAGDAEVHLSWLVHCRIRPYIVRTIKAVQPSIAFRIVAVKVE
jgi:hypothetical protein